MKRYIVATKSGKRPSAPVHTENLAKDTLRVCKAGWPDEKWVTFLGDYQPAGGKSKIMIGTIMLDPKMPPDVRATLLAECEARFSSQFKFL